MERLPWIIWGDSKWNHEDPYKSEMRRSKTVEGDVGTEAEIGVRGCEPRNAGGLYSWKRQGVDSPLEPPERISAANTFI